VLREPQAARSSERDGRRLQCEFSSDDWDDAYRSGAHREKWDLEWPTPELVAITAMLRIGPGAAALDLGCGTGSDALYLATRGASVTAVDVSGAALEIARGRSREADLEVRWLQASALALPLPSASIDLACDRGCLHSIPRERWPAYVDELARVVKPGAHILIRGCSDETRPSFVCVSEASIRAHFDSGRFRHRAIEPIGLCTARSHIPATLALLRRRRSSRGTMT
jgi:SAM-dependent methyltransferase